ncbi:MAG TPA: FtsX-like permease family protein [Tepidisphaeraceae bacterium]
MGLILPVVIRKLAISNFLAHRVRAALTLAAIALSVSLVVSVTSGYASFEETALKFLSRFMGSTDAQIYRRNDTGGVPQTLLTELRGDPHVVRAVERLELRLGMIDQTGRPWNRSAEVFGIERPGDKQVESIEMTAGGWFDSSSGNVAVVDDAAARLLKNRDQSPDYLAPGTALKVGEKFTIPGVDKKLEVTVVGIIHKPAIVSMANPSVYVPIETLRKFVDPKNPPQATRLLVDLERNVEDAFVARWEPRLKEVDPLLRLRMARDNRKEMKKNLQGVELLSYLGGAVSMLAATFIVFSALSMGVTERQRTLAMLRAVGMIKAQVARLVVAEGFLLGLMGVLIGVPLGYLWLRLLALRFHQFFASGVSVNWRGVIFGAGGLLVASVIASFIPAYSAMRTSPLEAMTPLAKRSNARFPWRVALLGLLLITVDPILMFAPLEQWLGAFADADAVRAIRFYGHFAAGIPAVMFGFFLLSPAFVWTVERLLGRIVAAMFGLSFPLLRQQLSAGIWRVAGTCTALMVGLAVLVAMQTQGKSALAGWKLPTKFPDCFVFVGEFDLRSLSMRGTGLDAIGKLESVKGIKRAMPIAIAAPELGTSVFSVAGAALVPNATMFIGIDPEKALDMMQLDFRQGNSDEAKRMLKLGRHVIVTEEYHQLKNIGVGDTLELKRPDGKPIAYKVAGVVWSPGIDVMVSMFDVSRSFDQRTVASVFGSVEDAQRDFGVREVNLFAVDLDYDAGQKKVVMERVKDSLGQSGVRVYDVRQIKFGMTQGLGKLLLLASTVAFAAMAVASLGVTNTIMASVRSRRWQFGVMRSVGVTRSQLLRLIMAEAMLIGLVGCALGLTAGVLMSFDAHGLSVLTLGYAPPIVFPWPIIWSGVGIVVGVSLVASVWPAVAVARAEPLMLLQAGRAAV